MKPMIRFVLLATLLIGVLAACTAEETTVVAPEPEVEVVLVEEPEAVVEVEEAAAVSEPDTPEPEAVEEETAVPEEEAPVVEEEPEEELVEAVAAPEHNSYQPDVALLSATGRPQFVSAYADW